MEVGGSAYHSGHLIPRKITHGTFWTVRSVGPRTGPQAVEKIKTSCLGWESRPGSSRTTRSQVTIPTEPSEIEQYDYGGQREVAQKNTQERQKF
jgi:hypothetical protein